MPNCIHNFHAVNLATININIPALFRIPPTPKTLYCLLFFIPLGFLFLQPKLKILSDLFPFAFQCLLKFL